MKTSIRWQAGSAAIAFVGLTFGPMAIAQIEVTPRLQVRQTWTDTANLDINGTNGDFITTISPGVQISGTTQRVQAFIDYTLNGLVFWKNSEDSDIRHNLNASVNTEIVEDRFFIDLRGAVQQNFQNFGGQISNIEQNTTQNRFTQQLYSVTPRWREQIGNFATAELSYNFSYNDQGQQGLVFDGTTFASDTTAHVVDFRVSSGRRFTRLNWNWNSRYQNADRAFRDFKYEAYNTTLSLDYSLNRQWALLGSVGYEDIRDETFAATQSGVIGDVGLRVKPGPRTQIEGRVGRRFGDTVFSALASYAFTDVDTLTASYSENLTLGNLNLLNQLAGIVDFNGDGAPDFPSDIGAILGPDAFVTDAAFRQKRANLNFSRQLRKTVLSANAFWENREFGDDTGSRSYGGAITGQYRIDKVHSVSSQLVFRHNSFDDFNSDDFLAFAPNYTVTISPQLNASANYNFTKRFSNNAALNRTTNSFSIALTAFF